MPEPLPDPPLPDLLTGGSAQSLPSGAPPNAPCPDKQTTDVVAPRSEEALSPPWPAATTVGGALDQQGNRAHGQAARSTVIATAAGAELPLSSAAITPAWGPPWWLRPADQATLAWLVSGLFLALAIGWYWVGRGGVQWMELEQLPPRTVSFEVDVNSADWPELSLLPGIGETLARRIVDYRQTHGPYRELEQLRQINGLGEKTLEKIRPFLVVRTSPQPPGSGASQPPPTVPVTSR